MRFNGSPVKTIKKKKRYEKWRLRDHGMIHLITHGCHDQWWSKKEEID